MRDDDWAGICLVLENGWGGDFDKTKRAAYRVFLDQYEPSVVLTALRRLAQTGKRFLPNVGEITAAINAVNDPQVPSWTEAWPLISRALWKGDEAKGLAMLKEAHPILAAFVATEGYRTLQLMPLNDGGDDDRAYWNRKALGDRWTEFVSTAQERLASGRALDAAGRTSGGPRQLDATSVLGLEPPAALDRGEG